MEIAWEVQEAGAGVMEKYGTPCAHVLDSIRENKVAMKDRSPPRSVPVSAASTSPCAKEPTLRQPAPGEEYRGVRSPYRDIDLVVVRENTEDLTPASSARWTRTRRASSSSPRGVERVCRFAFDYARREGRSKVTAVHKANILKFTDGLFLEVARAWRRPTDIEFEDRIVDNMAMQLVQKPHIYDAGLPTSTETSSPTSAPGW